MGWPVSSKEPGSEEESESAAPVVEEEIPAEKEAEEEVPAREEERSVDEEYEELIEPEKPKKPRKKRKHIGAIITVIVILIILLVWTVASPKILVQSGMTYVDSASYANLGNFTGSHKSWAANTTWGISVSGPDAVDANETFSLFVLVTKVAETPANFWFRGTAISITNVSVLDSGGDILGSMTNRSDLGFGKGATVKLSLPVLGNTTLKVTVQFLVYVDMRLGFLPVEKINLEPLELEPILVS